MNIERERTRKGAATSSSSRQPDYPPALPPKEVDDKDNPILPAQFGGSKARLSNTVQSSSSSEVLDSSSKLIKLRMRSLTSLQLYRDKALAVDGTVKKAGGMGDHFSKTSGTKWETESKSRIEDWRRAYDWFGAGTKGRSA
ncbi:hypothetical protein CVT26_006297 [Gymnopilus dilepis]|uniref:Uncharacterized protein n=1 Tax=Gymnopilus dilepis TaxID=231916 RepID=A0A409Y0L4_9AGAR|nr:hypothetical protein CVT26_006297 [Gymnopilus dilepis]